MRRIITDVGVPLAFLAKLTGCVGPSDEALAEAQSGRPHRPIINPEVLAAYGEARVPDTNLGSDNMSVIGTALMRMAADGRRDGTHLHNYITWARSQRNMIDIMTFTNGPFSYNVKEGSFVTGGEEAPTAPVGPEASADSGLVVAPSEIDALGLLEPAGGGEPSKFYTVFKADTKSMNDEDGKPYKVVAYIIHKDPFTELADSLSAGRGWGNANVRGLAYRSVAGIAEFEVGGTQDAHPWIPDVIPFVDGEVPIPPNFRGFSYQDGGSASTPFHRIAHAGRARKEQVINAVKQLYQGIVGGSSRTHGTQDYE